MTVGRLKFHFLGSQIEMNMKNSTVTIFSTDTYITACKPGVCMSNSLEQSWIEAFVIIICWTGISGHFILTCFPSMQPMQVGKFRLVKKSSDMQKNVSSDGTGMCSNCKISDIALLVSNIIEAIVLCAILNENVSPLNAILVNNYL